MHKTEQQLGYSLELDNIPGPVKHRGQFLQPSLREKLGAQLLDMAKGLKVLEYDFLAEYRGWKHVQVFGDRLMRSMRRTRPRMKNQRKKPKQEGPYHIDFIKDDFYSQFGKSDCYVLHKL